MKKYFAVVQPPVAGHFTLLVDDINRTATFGFTNDVDKCEYNRQLIKLMGLDIDFDIQVQTALSDKGVTGVIPVGRYISIIKASKDESQQEMYFFDSNKVIDFRADNKNLLGGYFSDNIVNQYEKLHSVLKEHLTDADDLVELSLVDEQ